MRRPGAALARPTEPTQDKLGRSRVSPETRRGRQSVPKPDAACPEESRNLRRASLRLTSLPQQSSWSRERKRHKFIYSPLRFFTAVRVEGEPVGLLEEQLLICSQKDRLWADRSGTNTLQIVCIFVLSTPSFCWRRGNSSSAE